MVLRCRRHEKSSGKTSDETRHYVSSQDASSRSPAQWDELIRGHWAGVEIRNHWRRDSIMREDLSRARNASQLANLSLLRNAAVAILARRRPDTNYAEVREELQESPKTCFSFITSTV